MDVNIVLNTIMEEKVDINQWRGFEAMDEIPMCESLRRLFMYQSSTHVHATEILTSTY